MYAIFCTHSIFFEVSNNILFMLQRYNLNQHKSTINHILTKKRALKRYVLPYQIFHKGKTNNLQK
nr:MAG TPA_asm: hypothetical protein [Caudoviricetes sp.]